MAGNKLPSNIENAISNSNNTNNNVKNEKRYTLDAHTPPPL
jgi:hypothetical protein